MENITKQLEGALAATRDINQVDSDKKQLVLQDLADALLKNVEAILLENKKDVQLVDINDPKRDRLILNEDRIQALAKSVLDVAQLPDPSGQLLSKRVLENGLLLEKRLFL